MYEMRDRAPAFFIRRKRGYSHFLSIPCDGFHGSEGERLVYEVLQRLSNDYVVFYSFRWLGGNGNRISLIFFFMKSRIPYAVHVLCYN